LVHTANCFIKDVSNRLANRVQLTSDGLHAYLEAVNDSFASQIDFAQLQKIYVKKTLAQTVKGNIAHQNVLDVKSM
jgi:hypothetical protein